MLKKEKEMKAEIIWHYLDTNGRCSTKELRNQLMMNDEEFLAALDRLLRKNKIVFNVKGKVGLVEQYYY
jgi:predicted HTH transcriptional regulator